MYLKQLSGCAGVYEECGASAALQTDAMRTARRIRARAARQRRPLRAHGARLAAAAAAAGSGCRASCNGGIPVKSNAVAAMPLGHSWSGPRRRSGRGRALPGKAIERAGNKYVGCVAGTLAPTFFFFALWSIMC